MSWQIIGEILSAIWKSMSRVLRVDHSIREKRTSFAPKAAKTSSSKIQNSTQTRENKVQDSQRDEMHV